MPMLEPAPEGGAGQHPIVVLFGSQANAATRLAGLRIPLGRTYHELAVAVPGLRRPRHDGAATALVRMYADYFPAVWNGRNRYGFGKEHTDISRSRAAFVVARTGGAPLCAAVHEPAGPWCAAPPALAELASWLSGTFLGWTPSGRCVESASLWDLATARARPVRVSLRAFEALLPGFGPGELFDPVLAAFEVDRVRWSLGWPEPLE
jgi:hypothetical protein